MCTSLRIPIIWKFLCIIGCTPPESRFITRRPRNLYLDSVCYSLIQPWEGEYLKTHKVTCPYSLDHILPTRATDVDICDGASLPLLHVSNAVERGEWIALNYSWRIGPHFATTSTTLNDFKQSIPFPHIPKKTFQNAITVTRHLGFRYLWIGSIRII